MQRVEDTYSIAVPPGYEQTFMYMTPREIGDYVHQAREVQEFKPSLS